MKPLSSDLPLTPLERKLQDGDRTMRLPRPYKKSWKPFSLRWPYQCFLIVFNLCLLCGIETLRQLSHKRQGFGRFETTTDISPGQQILYTILPSLVAVVYSTMWSFVDSDIKRLEPYFQMRSQYSPTSILLMDYMYESPFLVPWRAFKNRHFIVSMSSFVFLLVSLVVPPSQGALLSVEGISLKSDEQEFSIMAKSLRSTDTLNGDAVDQYGAISSQPEIQFPAWTTSKYAVVPFSPIESPIFSNETLLAQSQIYYSEPSCRRLNLKDYRVMPSMTGPDSFDKVILYANFSGLDDPACRLHLTLKFDISQDKVSTTSIKPFIFTQSYLDHSRYLNENTLVSFGVFLDEDLIAGTGDNDAPIDLKAACPHYQTFAGMSQVDIRSQMTKDDLNYNLPSLELSSSMNLTTLQHVVPHFTVYGCNALFYKSTGEIRVEASTERVLSVEASPKAKELVTEEFNKTNFEILLDHGVDATGGSVANNFGVPIEPSTFDPRNPGLWAIERLPNGLGPIVMRNLRHKNPLLTNLTQFDENNSFKKEVESLLQSAFALAVGPVLSNSSNRTLTTGTTLREVIAITVTPAFAIVSEVLLSISLMSLITILFVYRRRSNIIQSDPDSLAAQFGLLVDKFSGLDSISRHNGTLDHLPSSELQRHLLPYSVRYIRETDSLKLIEVNEYKDACTDCRPCSAKILRGLNKVPFFASHLKGCGFVSLLLISLVALLFLSIYGISIKGFRFPLQLSSFGSQLLWSFTPTIVSTSIESLWVSIHRDLGLLEPWLHLKHGYTTASESFSLRYSSRPPLLVLLLSAKRKHYLIAFISFISITTSVLNILSASLFSQTFGDFRTPLYLEGAYTTSMLSNVAQEFDLEEALEIVHYTIEQSTVSPSWVDSRYFIVPPSISSTLLSNGSFDDSTAIFNSTALAIGATLDCKRLTGDNLSIVWHDFYANGAEEYYEIRFNFSLSDLGINSSVEYSSDVFAKALETIHVFNMIMSSETQCFSPECPQALTVISHAIQQNVGEYYACLPYLVVQNRDVIHTASGQIRSSAPSLHLSDPSLIQNQKVFLYSFTTEYGWRARFSSAVSTQTDYDWPGLLMAQLSSKNSSYSMAELADEVFARVFAVWFALNKDNLLTARTSSSEPSLADTQAIVTTRQARISPSIPAFAIAIALILLYLLAFLLALLYRRKCFVGPRLPKTIGDLIPWVVESKMMDDFHGLHYMSSSQRDKILNSLNRRYALGLMKDANGVTRLRVDYDELITDKLPAKR